MRTVGVIFCLLAFINTTAHAQPADLSRVLRTVDFEERRLGNVEDEPMHWAKIEGPGLPHYVTGRLATDRARNGQYSFRFDLNGGGLLYRYAPRRIPARSGAHYRVETWVQTTVLPVARARLSAYFIDVDGKPITASVVHSPLYAAVRDDEPWHKLTVDLTADAPPKGSAADAAAPAYLAVELGLLQPALYHNDAPGKHPLRSQDISGSAWFDDLTISQVPQVVMTSGRPGNIFRRGDAATLGVEVSDRFTDDLSVQLVIHSAAGEIAFQRSGALDLVTAQPLGGGRKRVSLLLPELPAGWYEAMLVISSQGKFVSEQTLRFIQLADDVPPGSPDDRFGLIATDLPAAAWKDLPDLLPILSAGRIKLAFWSSAGDLQSSSSESFDRLLERLVRLGITPTACLTALPPDLAEALGGSSWRQTLQASPEHWQPRLAAMISRYASYLDRWQLGADGSEEFVVDPAMRRLYARIYAEFANLMVAPDLAMPWPAWYELDGELPATIALSVPPSVLPSQIPLYVDESRKQQGHSLSISLQLLDREQYGRQTQIIDLAQRIIYALAGGADRIDVPLPLSASQGLDGATACQPDETLLVLRTLFGTLSGARFCGKSPVAEGVEAFVFDRGGEGIIVLWDTAPTGGVRQLALGLGDRAMRVDLWGNRVPLVAARSPLRSELNSAGTVAVEIGPAPVLLVGVDGLAAQLRASVAVDRPLMESSFESHHRQIRFTNPYPAPISGSVRLRGPEGWSVSPSTLSFSLNPGESLARDLTIELPYNSLAGDKTLTADFAVQADRETAFSVPLTLTLGLSNVGMQAMAVRDGRDVLVHQMITNYGDAPIDYMAYAVHPGVPRQERLVTNLGPGRTAIKRYRFSGGEASAANQSVRCGVREIGGTRILNEQVPVQ
jgi:hypothetical protein